MELKNNKNIILEEKVGSVITMNTKHYCKMVYDHLNNNQICNKIDKTCDNAVMNKIKKLIQKCQNILTKVDIDYLTDFLASTSNFYGLPKIH